VAEKTPLAIFCIFLGQFGPKCRFVLFSNDANVAKREKNGLEAI
jgi:hypothetical protein